MYGATTPICRGSIVKSVVRAVEAGLARELFIFLFFKTI